MPTIIDISVALQAGIQSDPSGHVPQIEYVDHAQSVDEMLRFFPGATRDDLPDGEGCALERVHLTTHKGTHLDAPYHFASTMNRGERAMTIDEIPLDWCFRRGVKLDFRHFPDGYVATANDVDAELRRVGHTLAPLAGVRDVDEVDSRHQVQAWAEPHDCPDPAEREVVEARAAPWGRTGRVRDADLALQERRCAAPLVEPGAQAAGEAEHDRVVEALRHVERALPGRQHEALAEAVRHALEQAE